MRSANNIFGLFSKIKIKKVVSKRHNIYGHRAPRFPVYGFISLIIFFLIVTVFVRFLFKIVAIECISQKGECSEKYRKDIESVKNLDLISAKNKVDEILSANTVVKKYSLQLQLNAKYLVRVEERMPKYCLFNGNEYIVSDEDGLIIGIESLFSDKCLINDNASYSYGNKLSNDDLQAIKIFDLLKKYADIESARIESDNLEVFYRKGVRIIIPIDSNTKLLTGKAYYIISRFDKIEQYLGKSDLGVISEIDFRYKNPIIRYI